MLAQQALKFLATGILNTVFGYSLYAAFIFLGLNVSASLAIATILGVFFNFKTIGQLVFNSKDNSLIFKFFFIYIITFFINLSLIKCFVAIGFNEYFSGIIAIVPVSIMSFILNKYFVFKKVKK